MENTWLFYNAEVKIDIKMLLSIVWPLHWYLIVKMQRCYY